MSDKEEDYDYFDGEDIPDKKPEEETPEQKTAREVAADTIEVGRNKYKTICVSVVVGIVLLVCIWVWTMFWRPFVSEAQRSGYITDLQCEGVLFKTYEGKMITQEYISDTTKVYQRDFLFSIEGDSMAREMMRLQASGKRVTLTYKEYKGALPWRGNSKKIVTDYEVH